MIKFNNSIIDAKLFAELQDMAMVLSKVPDLEFDYQFGHYVHFENRKLSASHFWDHFEDRERIAGYKSDVLLRALGTMTDTNLSDFQDIQDEVQTTERPNFLTELFTLLEDLRLEDRIRQKRPGAISWFKMRTKTYTKYFRTQLETNVTRNFPTDELFCLIYLTLTNDSPVQSFPKANRKQLDMLEKIKPLLFQTFEARSTKDIVSISLQIDGSLAEDRDAINRYFVLPIKTDVQFQNDLLFDELMRTDPLTNDDMEDVEDQDEVMDEKFSTWHRENENSDRQQSFMRYELDQGTKTNILGDGARETEEGDQAMASVQGFSAESKEYDYSTLENLEEKKNERQESQASRYGKENLYAEQHDIEPEPVAPEDRERYQEFVSDIQPEKLKLKRTIDEALEHKQNAARDHLLTGRLSKKQLLPLIMDDDARVFYKKDHESKEIDAVFTLLIDCSASMVNKMDQTKRAAVLFHEVLKELRIPHTLIGFWEDGFEADDESQPNYFHRVISAEQSLDPKSGAEIVQLESQEDNRDGYSIRVAAEELQQHQAEHQILLVFSDGEPSACNYSENGIIDTHDAVLETRKRGLDVIGVFLSEDQIDEQEALMMKNIYGREHLLVEGLEELPDALSFLLRKILLSTI
ncbi:vWA domain-containing protein [Aquisalibacillus elongatus]|uniref:Nitric oxide reductase activation protein n=1 Tax=Aquisalibacillus elongatus TaxID=485577 RepID=A0A3N5BXA6_9BACI|nr:VWA domain-containing protein [Aquisalibacillus elongatus]RPF54408.1 nitric oxide reductase activation protein [Aquisalibacillus elongatus]